MSKSTKILAATSCRGMEPAAPSGVFPLRKAAGHGVKGRRKGAPRVFPARAIFPGIPLLPGILLLLLFFTHGCAKYPASTDRLGGTVTGKAISSTARTAIGVPYKPGGNGPKSGFDCSGLVCWVYAKNGVSIPRTTVEQNKMGSRVSKGNLQPGDVVVFSIRRGLHTGIYTGNGKFIHSPSRGKRVREENINQKYWKDKFIAGRRHKQLR